MGYVRHELPECIRGVFCTSCGTLMGFSAYPAVNVVVEDTVEVLAPVTVRMTYTGCEGNDAAVHPWVHRVVIRCMEN